VIAGFGVNQLDVDPKPVSTTLHGPFQHLAYVQFATNPLHIDSFFLKGEGGVARDYERASDARQVCGQAFSHAIGKIILLGIAANISEW